MVLNLRPKCANPSCAASFDWLAGGKMFRFPREANDVPGNFVKAGKPIGPRHIGHFWLCERCANIYTLQNIAGRGVVIQPLWPQLTAAANHMHLPVS